MSLPGTKLEMLPHSPHVCCWRKNGPSWDTPRGLSLLRVSDAGRSQRCGLHRGRRPKAFSEGTRGQ